MEVLALFYVLFNSPLTFNLLYNNLYILLQEVFETKAFV